MPTLAEHIRSRLTEQRMSYRKAARESGIERRSWSRWCDGEAVPQRRYWPVIEETLSWEPGRVEAIITGADYRDPETGETYEDQVERGLWDLRLAMAMLYVDTYGPERARELGEADARKHIMDHRDNQAKLRRMTGPTNPRPAQVA